MLGADIDLEKSREEPRKSELEKFEKRAKKTDADSLNRSIKYLD